MTRLLSCGVGPRLPLRTFYSFVGLGLLSLLSSLPARSVQAADPLDWVHWRGPEYAGYSREKGIPDKWTPQGENVLWAKTEFPTRSTPIVMNGKLYFVVWHEPNTTKEGEKTVCLDAKTGDLIWESVHNVFLSDAPSERVGWSSVVGDPTSGNIYVLGLGCQFQCLNGETGQVIWEHSMSEEYGMLSTYGGRTNFPVVYDDLVIISGVMTQWGENAVPAHRFVAFDKRTGAAVWFMSTKLRPEDTTYSTPVFTTFNGEAAMVFGAGDGAVYAVQPRTGKTIWKYDVSTRGLNCTPLIVDNIVYCGHGEKNIADLNVLGAVFAFDGRKKGEIKDADLIWKVNKKTVSRSAPLYVDGRVYFVEDGAKIIVVDAKTGKVIEEKKIGTAMFGSLLYADGKIYAAENSGRFWVFEPVEKGLKQLSTMRLKDEEIFASPIVSHGRMYVGTTKAMYCIGTGAEPKSDPIPPQPPEAPLTDKEIAHIQIAPVEAMAAPGQKINYQVRGYNKQGQFVKVVDAELTVGRAKPALPTAAPGAPAPPPPPPEPTDLPPLGTIEKNSLTVSATTGHSAASVTAKVGELTSSARVRIIPPLPWKFDFNDKKVPITWIGAAYRHKPIDAENDSMLVKISTIPKGMRSQSWMGWPNLHDYTVQADFFAVPGTDRRPDMGLINQRYTLDMMGKDELQIRSWTSRLENRFAKTIPFAWKPGTWYTMKFQSETGKEGVTLRGKVWPRGEAEPTEWTIEATDAVPNLHGSPGMFGNATVCEFYVDNVSVTPNQ
ncbi:MAG: PQQ-binding-like beta-propeller repeat protein [Pirellulales bacterium]